MTIATYSQEKKTDWIEIGETEKETIRYQVYAKNTAWFETIYKNNEEKYKGEIVKKELHLYKFDCDKKLWGVLSYLRYNDDGENISQQHIQENLVEMHYLVPNTIAAQFYEYICD
jgi:hypothetical protein